MEMIFTGVGSAFTTAAYYQSNMLLIADSGRQLLVDCGGDIRHSLAALSGGHKIISRGIDAVYISHLHADHVGGLEWLAFATYFGKSRNKAHLYLSERLVQPLWENCLSGGLTCIQEGNRFLEDYFLCHSVDASFTWENMRFTLIQLPHVVAETCVHYSYGLMIALPSGKNIFISTDTRFAANLLNPLWEDADSIFQDCETSATPSGVHAHYNDLQNIPVHLKNKMWLYHYQANPPQSAQEDGFCGFVQRGQRFVF